MDCAGLPFGQNPFFAVGAHLCVRPAEGSFKFVVANLVGANSNAYVPALAPEHTEFRCPSSPNRTRFAELRFGCSLSLVWQSETALCGKPTSAAPFRNDGAFTELRPKLDRNGRTHRSAPAPIFQGSSCRVSPKGVAGLQRCS